MICYDYKRASKFQLIKNLFLIHAMSYIGKEKCDPKFTSVMEETEKA